MNQDVALLMKIIHESNNIVFFGGAGVSTASGIPDFRGSEGLYNQVPEEILSHDFFFTFPEKFYDFYWSKMVYLSAKPNACHDFLAFLEKENKLKAVITQNIDCLHQQAGSRNVIELHGNVYSYTCTRCHKKYSIDELKLNGVPFCNQCHGIIKPDVVLYQEELDFSNLERALNYISTCEVLIVGGTSLSVYPAAGLINYFRGKYLIVINKDEIKVKNIKVLYINGNIQDILNIKNYKNA